MENRNEKKYALSVPQFGGWDKNTPGANTDYSMVFSQARANRKQQKSEISHTSLGNEKELLAARVQDDSVVRKKKMLAYLNCCIRP